MNYFSNESEWKWLFKNAIDWDRIIPLYYPEFPTEEGFENQEEVVDFFSEILDSIGNWSGTSVSEIAEHLDKEGPGVVADGITIPNEHLQRLYKEAAELQFYGICAPKEYGGLEAPYLIYMLSLSFLSRASIGACSQLSFFVSMIDMLQRFCSEDMQKKWIPRVIKGESSGCMVMTEPDCGSDLGAMKTIAKKQDDGTYKITGNKIFITNGGGGCAFTLAKTPNSGEGLKGLSLFFMEQVNDDESLNYQVVKNEEKMGMHGSFTCELVFENSVGHLLGEEGEGFRQMTELMNEARVLTGSQGLGGLEASLSYAKEYATQRKAFGTPLVELPLMKRNLTDWETERDAMRALLVDTTSHFDIYHRLHKKLVFTGDLNESDKKTYKRAKMWVRKRTPLVKFYLTEANQQISCRSLAVLGGHGYMKEYPMERYVRDSFAPVLYEGTSQIQALMAMKDLMKYTMRNPQAFFSGVIAGHPAGGFARGLKAWERDFLSKRYEFKKGFLKLIIGCLRPENSGDLLKMEKWEKNKEGMDELMSHAETLCQGLCYIETLRVLRDHANKDSSRAALYHRYSRLVEPRFAGLFTDWEELPASYL